MNGERTIPTAQPDTVPAGEHKAPLSAPAQPARDVIPVSSAAANLPALVPVPKRLQNRRWWLRAALALLVFGGAAGGGYYWWQRLHPALPPGIVFGNGRLEADEINIDTKYAARIGEILADEGDLVKAGQVVARMDTRDLQASLNKSEASVRQARRAVDEATANVAQQQAQVLLSEAGIRPRHLSRAERF